MPQHHQYRPAWPQQVGADAAAGDGFLLLCCTARVSRPYLTSASSKESSNGDTVTVGPASARPLACISIALRLCRHLVSRY